MTQRHCWNRLYLCLGVAAAGLILLITVVPRIARADGIPIPLYLDIYMPDQKAIIVYDAEAKHEDLVLSIKLLGESSEAAWVVPVPSPPEVNTTSAEWFDQLSELTKPIIKTAVVTRSVPAGTMEVMVEVEAEVPGRVEVLSHEQVGVYDISILRADWPGVLLDWLNEHGYTFPVEGEPILDAYVEEGWTFVATRVVPGEAALLEGDVQPLWLSFDAERPVYPMRLTALLDESMSVLIYVLADHRMEIEGPWFTTLFAGTLRLARTSAKTDGLEDLLAGQPYYITKLRRENFVPSKTGDDLYFRPAASDAPYRETIYEEQVVYVYETPQADRHSDPRLGIGLVILLLGLALGLVGWRVWAVAHRRD